MRVRARALRCGLSLLIVAVVVASFHPLRHNDFVNWDDPFYFALNQHYRGLSFVHLRWMFTTLYMGHYQPLSWLTHAVVYVGWGMNPLAYHAGNLLLHTANAVLFWMLGLSLLREAPLDGIPRNDTAAQLAAAVGALFFAVHPLRVEAVAWATERQEVLGAFFFLLTVLAYVRMQATQARHGAWRRWYVLSVVCFALSLISKAAGITLPFALLVLDTYPLQRLGGSGVRTAGMRLIAEKVPYLVVAGGAGLMVLLAKQSEAMVTVAEHGVAARTMQAFYALWFCLSKTVAPVGLSPLYLLQKPLDPTALRFVLSALVVLGITTVLILMRHRWPAALAAWAGYVILLLPVSGIVQSGPQITADRYTYLACMPWALLVAAGTYRTARSWTWPLSPRQLTVATTGVLLLLALSARTTQQTRVWHDSLTLWNSVLSVEPDNFYAYNNRGNARYSAGDVDGALADFDRSIALNPNYDSAYDNRGTARLAKGDSSGALADYNVALRLNPRYTNAYYNRGNIRWKNGDLEGALADYERAITLSPEYAVAYNARGRVHLAKGDSSAALADYNRAIELNPEYANAYNNRSSVRRATGDLTGALADVDMAVRLTPPSAPNRASFERNLASLRRQMAERGDIR